MDTLKAEKEDGDKAKRLRREGYVTVMYSDMTLKVLSRKIAKNDAENILKKKKKAADHAGCRGYQYDV